ncbi:MAG TPA: glutamine--fructose-6-phosphate transaminase (isomerizing) [Candidatus Sumerlaeota bacterium]|nr:glutamine--fructose-6-phosphate transaminase (isomerizing) [Candidatus Sumerlaeota bacterium]HPS01369.1 glutamine--fructose-6-phosphate transaminase (isomerizing) [Candidatus Sumerlaeota bacterium]
MCGIVGMVSRQNVAPYLLEGLKRLEYRGYDSAGIAILDQNEFHCERVVGRVSQLEAAVGNDFEGHVGIAHTRWATHGAPTVINAHPHFDEKHRIALAHNGIIENYLSLREYLKKKGYKIVSETDSELIAHLIADNLENNLLAAIQRAVKLLEGTFGLLILCKDDPNRLIAVRKGSPVILGLGDDQYFVASDVSAFVEHTRHVVHLQDGEMAELTPTGYRTMTFTDVTTVREYNQVDWEIEAIEKGGYDHFMLKEIFEQPQAIRNALAGRVRSEGKIAKLGGIAALSDERLRSFDRIIISACGTAWHAGMVGEYMIEELARIPVEVEYASELRYRNAIIDRDDLAVFISQSGETADTLAALREAKAKGAQVMGVCNVVGSTIAREAGIGSYTHAGPEIGVASTKAFTTQMAVLATLALQMGRLRDLSPETYETVLEDLLRVPSLVERALESNDEVQKLVPLFDNFKNCLYLGRGVNFPIALEGALKLKEISYIHAEGYPAAEMKHGPIALIEPGMPVVVIANQGPVYDKVMTNIEEIRARQGRVIAIATEGDTDIAQRANHVIYVPPITPLLSPFVTVIPLQLLAYHIAAAKGCDIDKPRNLAKSVTVE